MALDHSGMFHSNCISGVAAVLGRLISTLWPVAPDVAGVHNARERCGPEPCYGTAARIERQVVPDALIVPARAHDPAVVPALQIPLLGLRERGLVPRVPLVYGVSQGIVGYESLLVLPVLVVGGTEQDADAKVYVHQVR